MQIVSEHLYSFIGSSFKSYNKMFLLEAGLVLKPLILQKRLK